MFPPARRKSPSADEGVVGTRVVVEGGVVVVEGGVVVVEGRVVVVVEIPGLTVEEK